MSEGVKKDNDLTTAQLYGRERRVFFRMKEGIEGMKKRMRKEVNWKRKMDPKKMEREMKYDLCPVFWALDSCFIPCSTSSPRFLFPLFPSFPSFSLLLLYLHKTSMFVSYSTERERERERIKLSEGERERVKM